MLLVLDKYGQTCISTIAFVPIAELFLLYSKTSNYFFPEDIFWVDFQHSNWNGWIKSIYAEDAKQGT